MERQDWNGILLMNKPEGFTSHDVVAKLRGILHTRRIGHGGTLDPMATGVLPVFIGGATKAADFAAAQDKEYLAGFTLGYAAFSGPPAAAPAHVFGGENQWQKAL